MSSIPRIPLSRPTISERDIEFVAGVLRSGQLSLGPLLAEFEEKFAAYVGRRYAVAVNSGTSALHLAVKALGIGPGDEVLTSSFSFVASANCLLYEQASPVFIDIHPQTLNLNPAGVWAAIEHDYNWDRAKHALVNRRTGRPLKAILPVHVFGLPCDMAALCAIAREYNLMILEDACEALGAEYRGRRAGTFGEAGVFAFYPNKQMTTAEGGVITTDDCKIVQLCRSFRNQGRDDDSSWLRHVRLGYNYRLSDVHAALGIAQLERVDEFLQRRAQLAAMYSERLCGNSHISVPVDVPETIRSWFVYVIQLRGPSPHSLRRRLMAGLRDRGIASAAYFPAIHAQPYFAPYSNGSHNRLPYTDSAAERCIALPFFYSMTESQIEEVCATVSDILSQLNSPSLAQPKTIEVARAAF